MNSVPGRSGGASRPGKIVPLSGLYIAWTGPRQARGESGRWRRRRLPSARVRVPARLLGPLGTHHEPDGARVVYSRSLRGLAAMLGGSSMSSPWAAVDLLMRE